MAVLLPATPGPASQTWRLLSWRNDIEPPLGGAASRVDRLGARWEVDVVMPPMSLTSAMVWVARLVKGAADTVVMPIVQPGFSTGSPGTPRVNGSGQTGKGLNVDGMTNGYTLVEGQLFSVLTNGQRYVYQASADRTVASNAIAAAVEPMIRRSPVDNAVVEIAAPMIEGLLQGRETTWSIDEARTVGLAFTIRERE